MADKKISALTGAATPLAGTEVLPIVQSGATVKVSVDNLTEGKTVKAADLQLPWNDDAEVIFRFDDSYKWGMKNPSADNRSLRIFSKAADGAGRVIIAYGNDVEGLRLETTGNVEVATGNVVMKTAGKGIDFSANTHAAGMTSELLNDYEEGTWTATISDGTTDATMNAGRRTGTYTKVGRQVTVTGYIATTSMTGVTGNLRMKGLPFTAGNNDVGGGAVGYCDGSMTFSSGQVMTLQTQNGADYIVIRYWNGASGTVNMTGSQWGAAGEIGFTLTYFV